jgi:UDP-N-acetylmuramoylalanine--D-glutamate ligase
MQDELSDKRIVIFGLARQGKALARFAVGVGAKVIISDMRTEEQLRGSLDEIADLPVELVLGEHPLSLLSTTDVVAISGGVPADSPIVQEAYRRGITVTNDSLEFMKRTPSTVVGITGTAGKTTTTALTGLMFQATGRRTWVGGNIGQPLISDLATMEPGDIVIQELSSFQLELWTKSPPVAAVLNVTPNHLDRHKNMAAYTRAKSNILRFQTHQDVAVLSADDPGAEYMERVTPARVRKFSLEHRISDGAFLSDEQIWLTDGKDSWSLCHKDEIPLRGRHNILNVQAAALLADSLGVGKEAMRSAIRDFSGVEHRLELVRMINGVQYVNDSIATAPERAIAAIDSFTEPLILLAGGRDKDMVWESWAGIVSARVRQVVLFGELGRQLEEMLRDCKTANEQSPQIFRVKSLDEAVILASSNARPGDVVLLAPGGASFDAFVDFSARGEKFRQLVNDLA